MTNEEILQDIKELQKILFNIALDVKTICEENNFTFFLGEGSMIGAVREGGFIPWDDDIDLIMPRKDYQVFVKEAPRLFKEKFGDKYQVQHSTTIEGYWSPFVKIRLIDYEGKFKQSHIAHLTKNNGPYIDIFPIEYCDSKDSLSTKLTGFFVRYYRGLLSYKLGLRKPRKLPGRILRFASKFYSTKVIHAGLVRTLKPYLEPEGKKYMATFLTYHALRCQIVEASNYDETKFVDFKNPDPTLSDTAENKVVKMPIPAGYDTILRTIYGDYMTPPPVADRVFKHHFYDAD